CQSRWPGSVESCGLSPVEGHTSRFDGLSAHNSSRPLSRLAIARQSWLKLSCRVGSQIQPGNPVRPYDEPAFPAQHAAAVNGGRDMAQISPRAVLMGVVCVGLAP